MAISTFDVTNCCCSAPVCNATICIKCCVVGTASISGATVTVKSGSTVIATGTTDGTGCVTLNVGTAGSYTVVISGLGSPDNTSTQTLSCGGTTNIVISDLGCCFASLPSTVSFSMVGTFNGVAFSTSGTTSARTSTGCPVGGSNGPEWAKTTGFLSTGCGTFTIAIALCENCTMQINYGGGGGGSFGVASGTCSPFSIAFTGTVTQSGCTFTGTVTWTP
jgi:hypothetical protein